MGKIFSASLYERYPLELFFCEPVFAPFKPSKCAVSGYHHGYFQTSILRFFSCSWGISEWHFPSGLQVHLTDLPDCPTSVLWGSDQALWLLGNRQSWPMGLALFHLACSSAKNSCFKGQSRGKRHRYKSVAWQIGNPIIWERTIFSGFGIRERYICPEGPDMSEVTAVAL